MTAAVVATEHPACFRCGSVLAERLDGALRCLRERCADLAPQAVRVDIDPGLLRETT